MSLTYQYQWIALPVLGAAALSWPGERWRVRLGLLASLVGAMAVLGLALLAFRGLLLLAGVPQGGSLEEAVSRPEALALERLRQGGPLALLPQMGNLGAMAAVYHPLVFGVACLGLVWVPWRVRWMALAATATTLVAHANYSAPWTAMSAYPLLYLAAGAACVKGGPGPAPAHRTVGATCGAGGDAACAADPGRGHQRRPLGRRRLRPLVVESLCARPALLRHTKGRRPPSRSGPPWGRRSRCAWCSPWPRG